MKIKNAVLLIAAVALGLSASISAADSKKAAKPKSTDTPILIPLSVSTSKASTEVKIGGASDDFGSLPTLPGSYEILKTKVVTAPDYQYTQPDGQLRMTLSDIKVTINRLKATIDGKDVIWTGAQAAFTQYNSTQNEKRQHRATLTLSFVNNGGGPQGIAYQNVTLVRDKCRYIGRIVLPEVYSGKDLFDIITSVNINVAMTWQYEGGC